MLPKIAHWVITSKCNLQCGFCYKPKYAVSENFEKCDQVLERLFENGITQITLTGGEPTQIKEYIEYIKLIKRIGMGVSLHTNGQNVGHHDLIEIKLYVDNLSLAIDSHEQYLSDEIRSRQGYHENVINLAAVAMDMGIFVTFKTMVCKQNIKLLPLLACELSKIYDGHERGQWYLSEFTPVRGAKDIAQLYMLEEGEFDEAMCLISKPKNIKIIHKNKYEVASSPMLYFTGDGEVLCYDALTGSDSVIGNILEQSISRLWSIICDRTASNNYIFSSYVKKIRTIDVAHNPKQNPML